MAQAVIDRNLPRRSSGLPDSWKRKKTPDADNEKEKRSSLIILPEVQQAEKKRRVSSLTSQEPANVQLKIATTNFLSQLSSTHLSEEDIFNLGLVCLKELKKKHTDSGYQGSFWGNISTRFSEQHSNDELHQVSTGSSENQQVQSSEFLSNDDPASNDSSTQQRSSTGSSEILSVTQPGDASRQNQDSTGSSEVLTVNQNLLVSLSRKNGF